MAPERPDSPHRHLDAPGVRGAGRSPSRHRRSGLSSAIVVGSGPNGLAAAVRLARAGLDVTVLEAADSIGGGSRSSEMIVPGLVHDHCSAFHPIAAASPFLASLNLQSRGLTWRQPTVDCAHPLDDGSAGIFLRSIDRTAVGLGTDGQRWRRVFEPMTSRLDDLLADATQPIVRVPRHPLLMARFGAAAMLPATVLAGRGASLRPGHSGRAWPLTPFVASIVP